MLYLYYKLVMTLDHNGYAVIETLKPSKYLYWVCSRPMALQCGIIVGMWQYTSIMLFSSSNFHVLTHEAETKWTQLYRWHFQMHFTEWKYMNFEDFIKISQKFVPRGPINNISALVQVMAWRRPVDKTLSEPMMVSLLMHIHTSLSLNVLRGTLSPTH